jgi:hypothetical protein
MNKDRDDPVDRRVYRYDVELKELSSGTSHRIPLQVLRAIHIPTKKGEVEKPPRDFLRFQDADFLVEAESFEKLRALLRDRYPDERYERRLHAWRDLEAEERRAKALNELAAIFADAALKKLLEEGEGGIQDLSR